MNKLYSHFRNKTVLCCFIFTLIFVLACGVVSEIPITTAPAPTGTPTAAETRLARVKLPTTAETPKTMVLCVDHANARKVIDGTLAVVVRLERGDVVTLTGEVQQIGAELWQPTNYGLIDPKLLCEGE